jgi:hypothetical protein
MMSGPSMAADNTPNETSKPGPATTVAHFLKFGIVFRDQKAFRTAMALLRADVKDLTILLPYIECTTGPPPRFRHCGTHVDDRSHAVA